MSCKIHYVDNGLGTVIKISGIFEAEELFTSLEEHLKEPKKALSKIIFHITDYSEVTEVNASEEEIQKVVDISLKFMEKNSQLIVAIIADEEKAFKIARLWGISLEDAPWNIQVFRECEEAHIWLKKTLEEKFSITDLQFKV